MKRNKLFLWLHIVLPAIVFVLLGIANEIGLWKSIPLYIWAYDLKLRYNEINCAHEGIDPFDIFEGKVDSEKYYGIPRPDKPNSVSRKENRERIKNGLKPVHAYPPWHNALFWWYGYVPRSVCLAVMLIIYACSLIWVCKWTAEHLQEMDKFSYVADIFFLLGMIIVPFLDICYIMNYGLMLTGCTLLLFTLLERKQEVYAGFVYSLIMIKPQIGVLFLIPLFINKYYKTIAIAGVICILETLFTAWKLDKSPIELILQLPKIGAPFDFYDFFGRTAKALFGVPGPFISKGVFIAIALTGSLFVRNAKDIWVRFLPAVAMIPFWIYSQSHDRIILLLCYIYIFNCRQKYPWLYDLCFCLMILWGGCTFCRTIGWFFIGSQFIVSILHLAVVSVCCFMAIMDTNENWYRKIQERMHLKPN